MHLRITTNTSLSILKSPPFAESQFEKCQLVVNLHQGAMINGSLRIVIVPLTSNKSIGPSSNNASWLPVNEEPGNDSNQWETKRFRIGRITQEFQILFEVEPKLGNKARGHVSIDDLSLINCFTEETKNNSCANILCQKNKRTVCLKTDNVCDIDIDCDEKNDELFNCGKLFKNIFFRHKII